MTFLPGGQYLAVGGSFTSLELWDVENDKRHRRYGNNMGVVHSVSVSADGKYLMAAEYKEIHIWETRTGVAYSTRRLPDLGFEVPALFLRQEHKIALGGQEDQLDIWSLDQ